VTDQVETSGNVFAAFTPIAWKSEPRGYVVDPSKRTCIVSFVNKYSRPFRLKLKSGGHRAIFMSPSTGPCFGCCDVDILLSAAGLPPLPVVYDKTLLSGVDDGRNLASSKFQPAELEVYALDD
jgi:hypothetical protein